MPNIILCRGDVLPALDISAGAQFEYQVPSCTTGWEIVPYVEPTDSSLIYSQLVALNEFDPSITALLVSGSLVLFIIGYSAGMVLKRLRSV